MQRGSPHHSTWPRHTLKDATWQKPLLLFTVSVLDGSGHAIFRSSTAGSLKSLLCRLSACFPRFPYELRCEAMRGHGRAMCGHYPYLKMTVAVRQVAPAPHQPRLPHKGQGATVPCFTLKWCKLHHWWGGSAIGWRLMGSFRPQINHIMAPCNSDYQIGGH